MLIKPSFLPKAALSCRKFRFVISISLSLLFVSFVLVVSGLAKSDANTIYDNLTAIGLVSVSSDGIQANSHSAVPAISADGRYVAFETLATNLADTDTNGAADVFIRDRLTGQTSRVSIASDGTQANGSSSSASLSADGRFVAFCSTASNLVDSDTNDRTDVFVHDRLTGQTTRVSVSSAGVEGNGYSIYSSISGDGRYVAFASDANNLVSNDSNGKSDVFVHDRQTGHTVRVSVASDGTEGNDNSPMYRLQISANGRSVVFDSFASNLVISDTNTCGFFTSPGQCPDIFVHDIQTGKTVRLSVSSIGLQSNDDSRLPTISADGRFVAFESIASNLVSPDYSPFEVFVHDRDSDNDGIFDEPGQIAVTRISVKSDGTQAYVDSGEPSISDDGRYIAFGSWAALADNDTNAFPDVYVHDRVTGKTKRISTTWNEVDGNDSSFGQVISGDGQSIAFRSAATNLIGLDANGFQDIFVYGLPVARPSTHPAVLAESAGVALVSVTLDAASSITSSVNYFTSDGSAIANSDYIPVSGTLTFVPGSAVQTVTIPIIDDAILNEGIEPFTFSLSSPVSVTLGIPSDIVLNIADNDIKVFLPLIRR